MRKLFLIFFLWPHEIREMTVSFGFLQLGDQVRINSRIVSSNEKVSVEAIGVPDSVASVISCLTIETGKPNAFATHFLTS